MKKRAKQQERISKRKRMICFPPLQAGGWRLLLSFSLPHANSEKYIFENRFTVTMKHVKPEFSSARLFFSSCLVNRGAFKHFMVS